MRRDADGGGIIVGFILSLEGAIVSDVTRILSQIESGDPSAAEQLLPLVYEELRKLAAAKLAQEKPGQTLQATALVHEAYIRLVDVGKAQHWNSRGHFFGAAAEAMRRILVEKARRKLAASTRQRSRTHTSAMRPQTSGSPSRKKSSMCTGSGGSCRVSLRSKQNW